MISKFGNYLDCLCELFICHIRSSFYPQTHFFIFTNPKLLFKLNQSLYGGLTTKFNWIFAPHEFLLFLYLNPEKSHVIAHFHNGISLSLFGHWTYLILTSLISLIHRLITQSWCSQSVNQSVTHSFRASNCGRPV